MGNIKSFDIKNLLPFHKPGKGVPESIRGPEEQVTDLDPNLSPEEQVYVAHYLGYADVFLGSTAAPKEKPVEEKVIEMPAQTNHEPREVKKADGEDEAATA